MSVWAELVGQEPAVAQLQAAAAAAAAVVDGTGAGQGAMTHAWLFTGPPGSGRSVAARAFAAALQCPRQGCGDCGTCRQVLGGTHADVSVTAVETLSIGVDVARAIVRRTSSRPVEGRWQVTLVEDADRLTEQACNALLKALEEPPPQGVLLLCAPSPADLLPTILSRCRLVPLRIPPAAAVADLLVRRDGVDPAMAAWAARASTGHVGRARRLATDEEARLERADVLALPKQVGRLGDALAAAAALVSGSQEETKRLLAPVDDAERAQLDQALGVGATGGGPAGKGAAARGGAAAVKALEDRQKSRGTRTTRDTLDRALVDLAALYRDVLALQVGARVDAVHPDAGETVRTLARTSSPETTLRRLEAVLAARQAIEDGYQPQLQVEIMALALRQP